MIMSGLAMLASAVPTITQQDLSADYPGYYIPPIDTSTPLNRDQIRSYTAKLQRRLKMCQPTICNKCIKILSTNQRSRRHRACFTLVNLKNCCPIRKNFLASGPWWNLIGQHEKVSKLKVGHEDWIVTNTVLLWMTTSDFPPSARDNKNHPLNAPRLMRCKLYCTK